MSLIEEQFRATAIAELLTDTSGGPQRTLRQDLCVFPSQALS
jgi:hypothetical protein